MWKHAAGQQMVFLAGKTRLATSLAEIRLLEPIDDKSTQMRLLVGEHEHVGTLDAAVLRLATGFGWLAVPTRDVVRISYSSPNR